MISPSIDELLKNVNYSRYTLVSLAAKRARELNDGARSELDQQRNKKVVSVALEEIATQKACPVIESERSK